jgi:hypothetical protein
MCNIFLCPYFLDGAFLSFQKPADPDERGNAVRYGIWFGMKNLECLLFSRLLNTIARVATD